MALPLRLSLRYHPLFLELGRHIQKQTWGALRGAELQGMVADPSQARELIALFCYILGVPKQKVANFQGSVIHIILLYPSCSLQVLLSLVPYKVVNPTLWGSLSFSTEQMVEFRYGQEYFIACAPREGTFYHVALPEGSPEYYRALDVSRGSLVLPKELELEVDDFIQSLSL
ncbi:hypothetical protein [Gracilinema caldarium]|uniref:Uncharacterized protein n=1 Tax=Gracilinema caldarium (strain ATCC 51460 / DSM 7334 / H1) TaxID=744872 RepID=F8F0I6_GRAC1|nr:hypothetical protein [Gracilinema caldarium]AEJ19330.1 hypothetical protein Spica_1184 [Gracilinema caldarium DSM 7334]